MKDGKRIGKQLTNEVMAFEESGVSNLRDVHVRREQAWHSLHPALQVQTSCVSEFRGGNRF